MAAHFTSLDMILWLSSIAAEAAVVVLLLVRSMHCRFPIFFSFLCLGLSYDLLTLYIAFQMNYMVYVYVYWINHLFQYLLQFAILYEVMQEVFGQLDILPRHTLKLSLVACFAITAILAIISIAFPAENLSRINTLVVYLERGSEFLRGSALLLLLPFVSMLGLRWRHYALGIVVGFGLVATVNLVCSAVGATMAIGAVGFSITRYIPAIAEIICLLIWIDYFRKPEPAREQVSVEVLNGLKGVSNQLEDLYTSPVGMVRRLMWHSS